MTTTAPLTLTGHLTDFTLRTDYAALPDDVVHKTKQALLDLMGCALAGAAGDDLRSLVRGIKAYDRGNDASIWGTNWRASIPMATMANGTAAHARELDDCGGPGHTGTVVIPAALTAGEVLRRSGREVLAAIAIGYEVLFRIAAAVGGHGRIIGPGWHPISVMGGFGSAAAAGKLLGLEPEQLTWALGLAGSFTGGTWSFIRDGTMSKRWHPGRAAANGVEAVFLAREGFTGPTQILEPSWGGFYGTHFPNAPLQLSAITDGLGNEYRMMGAGVKAHACCRAIHGYLEALLRLMRNHGLSADDLAGIEAEGNELTVQMLGKREVRTILDAQMSLAYILAVAAYAGQVTLREFTRRWMDHPGVRRLAAGVTILVDPSTPTGPGRTVQIRLRDGRVLSELTQEPAGSLAHPLSDAELTAKFRMLAHPVVGPTRAERIANAVWEFEQIENVAEFCELLEA